MNSRDWALTLWDHGYQPVIVPLKKKSPAISWKRYQNERVQRELVETWFAHGEHNIALIAGEVSGTVVVDGDSDDACDYIESITPATMTVKTAKGAHYYFAHPGHRVPNAVRVMDDPPIDLRGDGGLTIGPGSTHQTGHIYQIARDSDLYSTKSLPVFDKRWFPLPETCRETLFVRPRLHFSSPAQQDAYKQATAYMDKVPGAVEGQGGDVTTYVVACRLVRGFNLSDEQALDLLTLWNAKCQPAWSQSELELKIQHARAYGTGEFGAMLKTATSLKGLLCFGWP